MPRKKVNRWSELATLIENYAEWSAADAMKGGGDPDEIPVVDAELELARAKLNSHIEKIRRDLGE